MKFEDMVYEIMCIQCPFEKKCHEDCVTCEEFDGGLKVAEKIYIKGYRDAMDWLIETAYKVRGEV